MFELKKQFFSDPGSGLLPITNTLDFFNIEYIAANVPKTALQQLPKRFITQVTGKKIERIVLVTKTNTDKIKIELNDKKELLLTKAEFLNDWTGLVIAIEENKQVSKSKLTIKQKLKGLAALSISLLTALIGITTKSFIQTSYFILSLNGLGLALLIIKEKFSQDSIASKFCKINAATSCESVLTSKSAQITKGLDLSDTVILYFLFTTLSFLVIPNSNVFIITAILSIPIVLYSIYQQYVVIKKWCPLCLAVATVLVLQCILLIITFSSFSFGLNEIIILTAILALTVASWFSIKPLIIAKQKNNALEIENLSFRRNYNLFLPYYNNLESIKTEDDKIPQISLGAKNPLVTLTVITNPLCRSCIDAHKTFMDLLHTYDENLQINFRFLVPYNNKTDGKTIIAERLLQLYFEEDLETFKNAFNNWYHTVNTKQWTAKIGTCNNAEYNTLLANHANWCLHNGIDSTPTILINGKLFPTNYNTKDIIHFIYPILQQKSDKIEELQHIHA